MNDYFLNNVWEILDSFDVISFDIFDTLLFRICASPQDVFKEIGIEVEKGSINGFCVSADLFIQMRMAAERKARERAWKVRQKEEIDIFDIYDEFLNVTNKTNELISLEIETERKLTYVNINIYEFLKLCFSRGKTIVLASDFYFTKNQMIELLVNNGVDMNLISFFALSSEYAKLKYNGGLFSVILNHYSDVPIDRILHIGDSKVADIQGATRSGIQSLYYGIVPPIPMTSLTIERDLYGGIGEIETLRKLALHSDKYGLDKDKKEWFNSGAGYFGPVYTFFAEWIVEQAVKHNVTKIITFMREGRLLRMLIERAIKNRNLDIEVKEIYISRRTTEIVSHEQIDETIINEYLYRTGLTLEILFSIFYLDINDTKFEKYKALTIQKCIELNILIDVREYLLHDEILKVINLRVTEQRQILIDYIFSLIGNESVITVDIGFRGTMQNVFSSIIKRCGRENKVINLLLMGLKENISHILNGVHIEGWLGYAGENLKDIEYIYRRIQVIEAVTNANHGTTIAYRKEGGNFIPVFDSYYAPIDEIANKDLCWDGIHYFQSLWFELLKEKPRILNQILNNKKGFLNIFRRLLEMPSYEEAEKLGSLYYDESILTINRENICAKDDFDIIKNANNADKFIRDCENNKTERRILWPEGIIVITDRNYTHKKYIRSADLGIDRNAFDLLFKVKDGNHKKIAIYGAGEIGVKIASLAQTIGVNIALFIDRNPRLQSKYIEGIKVLPIEDTDSEIDGYIVASYLHADVICQTIEKHHCGSIRPTIYLI